MPIRYEKASDLQEQTNEIARVLFPHVKIDDVVCLRSFGSTSRGTIARCHGLGKAMQLALGRKGFYVIEVISSRFDKLSEEEKIKTLIHELMHIPKSFGGGFIHHNMVHEKNVNKMYEKYINLKRGFTSNTHNNFNYKENYVNEQISDDNLDKFSKKINKKRFFDVNLFKF